MLAVWWAWELKVYKSPTLDDFAARIDWHLNKAKGIGLASIEGIEAKANATGRYYSGIRIKLVIDAALSEFDKGVSAALGELKRVAALGVLDNCEMRSLTGERLKEFAAQMRKATRPSKLKEFGPVDKIDEMMAEFDARLNYQLRQFDVGFADPPLPEEPQVTHNNIRVQTMIGGAIQQGVQGSSVVVKSGNIDVLLRIANEIDSELAKVADCPEVANLKAEVATIRAQLSKSTPNQTILAEAGRSLRSIAEGVFAGAITNRTVQLAADLARGLGLI